MGNKGQVEDGGEHTITVGDAKLVLHLQLPTTHSVQKGVKRQNRNFHEQELSRT